MFQNLIKNTYIFKPTLVNKYKDRCNQFKKFLKVSLIINNKIGY